jgi:oligosaccharide translocation protein RFT1
MAVPGLAGGLGTLFALQLFTRLLSFAVNAFLARSLGPAWYAFANVQLHLVASTALFLPKEGLRRAAQRVYPGGAGTPLAWGMNVAWLSVPVAASVAGLLVAAAAAAISGADSEWEALMGRSEARATLLIAALAAAIEAACEPGWVYAQANLLLPQRALAEGAALVAKALTACALILRAVNAGHAVKTDGALNGGSSPGHPPGLGLAFGLSQLAYSISFLALLYALAVPRGQIWSLAPKRAPGGGSITADGSTTAAGSTTTGAPPAGGTAPTTGSPPISGSLSSACSPPIHASATAFGGTPIATGSAIPGALPLAGSPAIGGSPLIQASATTGGHCYLPRHVWVLTAQSVAQAAQKYLLTEGERLVVIATSPIESQGVYALVTNLSSLVGVRLRLFALYPTTLAHLPLSI